MDPETDLIEEWDLLTERQQEMAEDYAETALKFGMWNQSSGADGAHYAPASANPFKADGILCQNCVFFDETNSQCQIVAGPIEPEAVCKLWIIPETSLIASRNAALERLALKRVKVEYM